MQITIPGKFTGLMIVRGSKVEVEGISIGADGTSQHLSMVIPLKDVGELTRVLVNRSPTSFVKANMDGT